MIIQIATTLVFAAACLATIATVAVAPASAARRTVVVRQPPIVGPGDVSESWDARQNVLDGKRYE
jgi:Spy/CpxP family protein refolding chaperone